MVLIEGRKGVLRPFFVLCLLTLMLIVSGCVNAPQPETSTDILYQPYENVAAFDMLYPDFWSNNIISEGLIVFAAPDQLDLGLEEPAASMVVFRRLAETRFTVEEDHQHFLDTGPLTADFQIIGETTSTTIGGLDALTTTVSNPDAELPVTVRVISTRTSSGFNYTFSATAPNESWEQWQPNFQIMFGSVSFNE